MKVKGESSVSESITRESAVLSSEVLAGQDRLKQKIRVQEKVMIKLRFVPSSFDVDNYDRSNHVLSAEEEDRARSWSEVKNQDGETRSAVFMAIYTEEILKFPEQKLSEDQTVEIVEKIANRIKARESEWT